MFGLIDYFTGRFFCKGHDKGRLTEARLKRIFPARFGKRRYNPLSAQRHFKQAISLFPNGTHHHLQLLTYLHRQNNEDAVIQVVKTLTEIYPSVYHDLRQAPFWNSSIKAAAREGLKKAIEVQTSPRTAQKNLSDSFAAEKRWAEALDHYRLALRKRPEANTAQDYFHLGRLYFNSDQPKEAEFYFFKGLALSPNRDREVVRLCRLYKEVDSQALLKFYRQAKQRYNLSIKTEIALIRSLIQLKQYNRARDMLITLTQLEPSAEAYYWLARIAEHYRDWDQMELAIQRATVLAPLNTNYRRTFFNLLNRLGKHDTAELELGRILQQTNGDAPALYAQRAKLRYNRKAYQLAITDWQAALRITPRQARYYALIAESHRKLGDDFAAIHNYKQALKLEPDNNRYRQKLRELDPKA